MEDRAWEILPPSSFAHSVTDDILDVVAPPSGVAVGDTILEDLQTGEKIVNTSSKLLNRYGREDVYFRIVGDCSFGWGEAAVSWGGEVEAIIHRQHNNHNLYDLFKLPKSTSVAQALARKIFQRIENKKSDNPINQRVD